MRLGQNATEEIKLLLLVLLESKQYSCSTCGHTMLIYGANIYVAYIVYG